MKFSKGDLVKSNTNKSVYNEEKEWYGIVLELHPDAPEKYPIIANKYKVKWCGGNTSWIFEHSIDLVSRGRK